MSGSPLGFALLLDGLKAAGEDTRLRLLALIGEGELTVSELTEILGQSQPRISRHLKLLAEAGLVERFREASQGVLPPRGRHPRRRADRRAAGADGAGGRHAAARPRAAGGGARRPRRPCAGLFPRPCP
ncbi:ArsR/SmtB family transcription factor [Ancylobacter dichloromethanicus]